ncbi:MAG: hypothetical protein MJ107_07435, partial [Lachnospiraceae bacterium]|nr:hypothetical protein [Lachnospiraceae bacterium]
MKKFKRVAYNIFLGVLTVGIIVLAIIGMTNGKGLFKSDYDDGIKQIDLNTIFLSGSGVEVHFSDVILGIPGEQRKLIVMEQEGDVETELTDRLIKSIDWEFLKKSQKVKYTGKGYFVVDLDKLTKDNIVED